MATLITSTSFRLDFEILYLDAVRVHILRGVLFCYANTLDHSAKGDSEQDIILEE